MTDLFQFEAGGEVIVGTVGGWRFLVWREVETGVFWVLRRRVKGRRIWFIRSCESLEKATMAATEYLNRWRGGYLTPAVTFS